MKKNSINGSGLHVLFLAAMAISILISSCAKKVQFNPSSSVAAAEGSVKIKKDDNDNYAVSIKLLNLTDPQRLEPAKRTYVAWIETQRDGVKNLGQLKSSKGLFSSTLESTLNTVTPFKPVRVFITAENEATLQQPGRYTVIKTREFD